MFASEQDFIQCLYDAGWTDARDAQHEKIAALYRELEPTLRLASIGIRLHENMRSIRALVELARREGWKHIPMAQFDHLLLLVAGEDRVVLGFSGVGFGASKYEANSNLIAAAPELLDALKAVLSLHIQHHNDPLHAAARAAIAKAEGA